MILENVLKFEILEFSPSTLFIFVGWLHSNVNGYIGQVIHHHVGNRISGEITILNQNAIVLIESRSRCIFTLYAAEH